MKLVRESISFQRGLDPQQALGVGLIPYIDTLEGKYLSRSEEKYYDKLYPWNLWMMKYPVYLLPRGISWNKSADMGFYKNYEIFDHIIVGFYQNHAYEKGQYVGHQDPSKEYIPVIFKKTDKKWTKFKSSDIIMITISGIMPPAEDATDVKDVSESINFQRGLDPKKALDVGVRRSENIGEYIKDSIENLLGLLLKPKKTWDKLDNPTIQVFQNLGKDRIVITFKIIEGVDLKEKISMKAKIRGWIQSNLPNYKIREFKFEHLPYGQYVVNLVKKEFKFEHLPYGEYVVNLGKKK